MNVQQAIERLSLLTDTIPAQFSNISADEIKLKPLPNKWSKQEIMGHLIDSAANNLQRFVRIQFEDNMKHIYDQDNWVAHSHYQSMETDQLITLWQVLNKHLAFVASHIPADALDRTAFTNGAEPVTLSFLIIDYVEHQEHHLKDIFPNGY